MVDFKEMFARLPEYIRVSETVRGIETYINPDISKLPEPIKAQIRAFIGEINKMLTNGAKK